MPRPATSYRPLFLCIAAVILALLVAPAVYALEETENANPHNDARVLAQAAETRCEKGCTREYMPVCGSDGVTYANRCLFRNAKRCRYRGHLYITKVGSC